MKAFIIISLLVCISVLSMSHKTVRVIEDLDQELTFPDRDNITFVLKGPCVGFSMIGIDNARFSAYLVSKKALKLYEKYNDVKILSKSDLFGKSCDRVDECIETEYISDYENYCIVLFDRNIMSTGKYLYNLEVCDVMTEYVAPVIFILIEMLVFVIFVGLICRCFS